MSEVCPGGEIHSPVVVNHIYGTGRRITVRPERGEGLSGFQKRPLTSEALTLNTSTSLCVCTK